jgi:hypothetical protein
MQNERRLKESHELCKRRGIETSIEVEQILIALLKMDPGGRIAVEMHEGVNSGRGGLVL